MMRNGIDVHNHLQEKDIKHELVSVGGSIKNALRMAELLDLDPRSIVKNLVFFADGTPVLAMVPGDCHVSSRKLKKVVQAAKVEFANDDQITEVTGCLVGATPPVGWVTTVTAVVDPQVIENDIIYTAGGETDLVLKMRARDLVKATGATVADIIE